MESSKRFSASYLIPRDGQDVGLRLTLDSSFQRGPYLDETAAGGGI